MTSKVYLEEQFCWTVLSFIFIYVTEVKLENLSYQLFTSNDQLNINADFKMSNIYNKARKLCNSPQIRIFLNFPDQLRGTKYRRNSRLSMYLVIKAILYVHIHIF